MSAGTQRIHLNVCPTADTEQTHTHAHTRYCQIMVQWMQITGIFLFKATLIRAAHIFIPRDHNNVYSTWESSQQTTSFIILRIIFSRLGSLKSWAVETAEVLASCFYSILVNYIKDKAAHWYLRSIGEVSSHLSLLCFCMLLFQQIVSIFFFSVFFKLAQRHQGSMSAE